MNFHLPTAEIFIPDGLPVEAGLGRTTHMAISAHQDDIEIMAAAPILDCFQQKDLWFTGVVVTDGRGSPRDDLYKDYDDEEMRIVRFKEQKKAAVVGEFAALALLDFPSKIIKDGSKLEPVADIAALLKAAHPQSVYTHNLADKHDTHVAVARRVIAAIRSLSEADRPEKLYGCEVWRDLDWLLDEDKQVLPVSARSNIAAALVGVFDSQVSGGKRYDLATAGRRLAHATYHASHGTDQESALNFAMDLTPLIEDPSLAVADYVLSLVDRFRADVAHRVNSVA
jgi:LmbE family N-acetylglucosaminyl deacetylase